MKKVIFLFLFILVIGMLGFGCTQQERAKEFGGTATITLPAGQKLITVTWKQTEIWYLTRPMRPDETPEKYTFKESSSFGLLEGTVMIEETR